MRAGLAASTIAHAAVIVFALVSFTGAKPFESMPETVPVDVVSMTDLTKMMKGTRNAPKAETPKQVAEKVAPPSPVDDPKLKVSEKPPVEATAPPPPPPPPPPKVDQPQPAPPKAEQAPPKEQADVALKPEPQKQEQPKEEAKSEPAAAPLPPRKPAPPREPAKPVEAQNQPQRDASDRISELLDKQTPTRRVASADAPSSTQSLGTRTGGAATLSVNYQQALHDKIFGNWYPAQIPFDQWVQVVVRFTLRPDGSLAGTPRVIESSPAGSPYVQAYGESAIRAVMASAPFSFLPQSQYEAWKEIEIGFTPDEARKLMSRR
ncbi:TonB C-terminal domain-containing protein [Xanthobacter dioxanivorans]|uniref:TonB C-terminal domain-containing protein n=1 Tax=Xanthobacter dioxanivorans TaxID=2528964 RepID=A0A974SJ39_9HYPH|nr:TonB C-terminal domain-containing protein [Xanthobacter dioxanivorans]QRG07390.1 TonB C-terminal domain-containing protein [Xanthobacter dioxanivorans]